MFPHRLPDPLRKSNAANENDRRTQTFPAPPGDQPIEPATASDEPRLAPVAERLKSPLSYSGRINALEPLSLELRTDQVLERKNLVPLLLCQQLAILDHDVMQ